MEEPYLPPLGPSLGLIPKSLPPLKWNLPPPLPPIPRGESSS